MFSNASQKGGKSDSFKNVHHETWSFNLFLLDYTVETNRSRKQGLNFLS